jgi:DNA-binding CsgD family transcriptional regulator
VTLPPHWTGARQAQRLVAAGDLGWTLRFTGQFTVEVLIEADDLTAARHSLTGGLAWAYETGDMAGQVHTLTRLADVELRAGNLAVSGRHLREAVEISARVWPAPPLGRCLDLLAHLCAARGQWAEAVTIWAAAQAELEAEGSVDVPLNAQRRQDPRRRAAQALGPDRTRAAQERGAVMSRPTVTEFALMLADTPPAQPGGSAGALAQLSAREQDLVSLVARGSTDAQIASQLFISISTVRTHLDRIRDKTGCRRRPDLTRLALQAGLV